MLVDNVDLAAQNGSRTINFGFRDPGNRLPYQVKSITGLDADEIINHFVGNSSTNTGVPSFSTPTIVKREVTLLLGLNPDWGVPQTFSSLRDDLYRLISACPSGGVLIRFNYGASEDDSHVKAYLVGRISKVEANHFVDRPEVQLTITADEYPMLEAWTTETQEPIWIERSELGGTEAVKLIDEISTASHGFEVEFSFTGTAQKFKMEGLSSLDGLRFEIAGFTFANGDVLHLRSKPNDKAIYVVRSGVVTHLLDKVSAESIWPLMIPGDNYYTWATATSLISPYVYGTPNVADWYMAGWTPTFWGV